MRAGVVSEMRSISWMIAELVVVDNVSNPSSDKYYVLTYVTTLLPEPAIKFEVNYYSQNNRARERTFSMDPK